MSTPIDIAAERAATPGCAHVAHFNHAGSSLMSQVVIDTVVNHIQREGEIGGYEAADEAFDRIDGTYDSIARLINGRREEIALIENATRAWDMAFYAIPFETGDEIFTSVAEYGSNVIAFLQMKERGVRTVVVPNDARGQLDVKALAEMMHDRVRVVAVSHMPTNGGLVQPVEAIGSVVSKWPALYLLDACQSIGQMPIDVKAIGCDVLSGTSRKYLRGPRGQGFLYVQKDVIQQLEPPMLDIHAATWTAGDQYEVIRDARRFENWERSYANILGMKAAIDHANALGLEEIWHVVQARAHDLRTRLAELPNVRLTDVGQVKSGIVTFTHSHRTPEELRTSLAREHVNVSTASVYSTRFDMEDRGLDRVVRASVHYLTTTAEIDRLCDLMAS